MRLAAICLSVAIAEIPFGVEAGREWRSSIPGVARGLGGTGGGGGEVVWNQRKKVENCCERGSIPSTKSLFQRGGAETRRRLRDSHSACCIPLVRDGHRNRAEIPNRAFVAFGLEHELVLALRQGSCVQIDGPARTIALGEAWDQLIDVRTHRAICTIHQEIPVDIDGYLLDPIL